MFANMDYPFADAGVRRAWRRARCGSSWTGWRRHPCVAVLCGNSEVEQQAAMWGAPREQWQPPLLPRGAAGAVRGAGAGRALLAVERARRRLPAPGQRRHHLVLRRGRVRARRSTMRGAAACASPPSAWPSPTSPSRPPWSACRAAWPRACTIRSGRRARRATWARAGTSTTCATTTCASCSASTLRGCAMPTTTATWRSGARPRPR